MIMTAIVIVMNVKIITFITNTAVDTVTRYCKICGPKRRKRERK